MNCRHCHAPLEHVFLDLGSSPPSNGYLDAISLRRPETYLPLRVLVCKECWLVQVEHYAEARELFGAEYAYFSSVSTTWLAHSSRYTEMIKDRLGLDAKSLVVELACNDGYLLRNFVAQGIPCIGIEPTHSTAATAEAQGIPVIREFFGEALGRTLAESGRCADLVVGNNVYAHVPEINDFTYGMKHLLKPGGTITLEFPHLMCLIAGNQFDTVYHEHYSYLSLLSVSNLFAAAGLRVYDVEQLPTHGGSLRVYGCHSSDAKVSSPRVESLTAEERKFGLNSLDRYANFQPCAEKIKNEFLDFLLVQKRSGRKVCGYGAAAKGNTLLNFAGVRPDLLPYVCDAAPSKQGKFLPGSHIPIEAEARIRQEKPAYVVIFPWNIREEVMQQLSYIREWNGQFVTTVPAFEVT